MSITELLGGAIGSVLLGLGGASLVAWYLRRGRTDHALLYFGLWCSLYGARLVAEQPEIVAAIGVPPRTWIYVRAFITYAINVPIGLFLESLIGPGWKQSVRRAWQVQAVYAIAAIGAELILGRPQAAMTFNSPLVLIGLVIGLANLWMFRDRLGPTFRGPAIAFGAAAMMLLVINENLQRPLAPDVNLEPLGVFAFVVSLGYGVAANVFQQEAELVAVQRELETARQIQASLLPRELPRVTGLDMAARYLPMTQVAGDLYDVVPLGPEQAGILVADVSGHGVPAALVASMVKLAFSAQAEQAHDPAAVLGAINRILCRTVAGTFVTAVYAVVDTGNRTITLANAGHPALLVGRSRHLVDESREHGLLLGVLGNASYVNERLALREGDCVLLYTDGIPEAQNAQNEFLDADRLKGWLAAVDHSDASDAADDILRRLRAWRGRGTFDDDVTLVVARFDGEPSKT